MITAEEARRKTECRRTEIEEEMNQCKLELRKRLTESPEDNENVKMIYGLIRDAIERGDYSITFELICAENEFTEIIRLFNINGFSVRPIEEYSCRVRIEW